MAWVRIDDRAMSHPKIIGLSDKAFRLWVWGLAYAQQHLTDGHLPSEAMPAGSLKASAALLERRLWELAENGRGFQIHDYIDWNDSREVVLARRDGAKKRVDDWRKKRVTDVTSETRNNGVCNATSETPLARLGLVRIGSFSEKESEGKPSEDALAERAGRLLQELYPDWYAKYRHGAKLRLIASPLAFQEALSVVEVWDDARIEKLARIVLTTDDDWISRTDRSFTIFAKKASWADDRLRQAESGVA